MFYYATLVIVCKFFHRAPCTVGASGQDQDSAARNHMQTATKVIQFAEIDVDERTARRTGLPFEEAIYYVQRVRYVDGKPVIMDINVCKRTK